MSNLNVNELDRSFDLQSSSGQEDVIGRDSSNAFNDLPALSHIDPSDAANDPQHESFLEDRTMRSFDLVGLNACTCHDLVPP